MLVSQIMPQNLEQTLVIFYSFLYFKHLIYTWYMLWYINIGWRTFQFALPYITNSISILYRMVIICELNLFIDAIYLVKIARLKYLFLNQIPNRHTQSHNMCIHTCIHSQESYSRPQESFIDIWSNYMLYIRKIVILIKYLYNSIIILAKCYTYQYDLII